jgi:hypothetical protein
VASPDLSAVLDGNANALTDLRPPGPRRINLEPIKRLERAAGDAVMAVKEQADEFRLALDAELCSLVGNNELPPSVQAMASQAVDAMVQHRLLSLAAAGSAGRWAKAAVKLSEATLDTDIAKLERNVQDGEAALVHAARHAAGIAIVARDLLQSARAAAKEARATGSPTEQLMARLGVGQAIESPSSTSQAAPLTQGSERSDPVPDLTPGGGSVGAPLSPNSPPRKAP